MCSSHHFWHFTHPDKEGRDGAVDGGDVGLEPEAGTEAHHGGQVPVVVPDTIHPVHGQELGEPDEEVGPACSVVIQQVHDVATTLRNAKDEV